MILLLHSVVKLVTNIFTFPLYTLNETKVVFQLLLMMSNKLQLIFPGDLPLLCGDDDELLILSLSKPKFSTT